MRSLFSRFIAAALTLGTVTLAEPAEHPALVDLRVTDCQGCHADLMRQLPVLHAPAAEDCSVCHQVAIREGMTSVTLVEAEPALCLECHAELAPAADFDLLAPHAPVGGSCLSCHDAHATSADHLLSGSAAQICGSCHVLDDLEQAHGGQLSTSGECSGCHDAHGSDVEGMLSGRHVHSPFAEGSCDACHRAPFAGRSRFRAGGNAVCESCHGDPASGEASASAHGALEARRGRPGCLNCHDPHLSENRSLLLAVGPAVCRTCHAEVVAGAEAPTGHAPAAEDCLTCHQHHAAERENLLSEEPAVLCATCHDPDEAALRQAHLGADPTGLHCLECHSPHGVGQPHLLARVVHAPILDGCDLCHEGSVSSLVDGGGEVVCSQCHDEVADSAAASAVPHAALELTDCSECHNPHAAGQENLVRLAGDGVCVTCHEEQAPGEDEIGHGVIEILGCQACHEPHGGQREKLLRVSGSDLCLSCHDPRRLRPEQGESSSTVLGRFELSATTVRSMASLRLSLDGQHDHPVKDHRVLGPLTKAELRRTDSTFRGEFTCLTCHDPHKGRSRQLLRWKAATAFEASAHCHQK